MYCPKCGKNNEERARFCGTCGLPFAPEIPVKKPPVSETVETPTDNTADIVVSKNRERNGGKGDLAIKTSMDCEITLNNQKQKTENKYVCIKDLPFGEYTIIANTAEFIAEETTIIDKKLTKIDITLNKKLVGLYAKSDVGPYQMTINDKTYECPEMIENLPAGEYDIDVKFNDKTFQDKISLTNQNTVTFDFTKDKIKQLEESRNRQLFDDILKQPENTIEQCQSKVKELNLQFEATDFLSEQIQKTIKILDEKISKLKNDELTRLLHLPEGTGSESYKKIGEIKSFQSSSPEFKESTLGEIRRLESLLNEYNKTKQKKVRKTLSIISVVVLLIVAAIFVISGIMARKAEESLYKEVVSGDYVFAYSKYLSKYGKKGRYYDEIEKKKKVFREKEEDLIYNQSVLKNSLESISYYLKKYPNGKYQKEAQKIMEEFESKQELANQKELRQELAKRKAQKQKQKILLVRSLDIEWIKVSAGSFKMGSNNGGSDEKPVHEVTLETYHISKYEVTFDQYDKFCNATSRSKPDDKGWGRGSRPVINVTWHDAKAFCDWLSKKTGQNIYLPTEAQHEYAARGGNKSRGYKYSGSDSAGSVGWYHNNSNNKTHPVGQKNSNELGIYDMSGNVWEWCSDWYGKSYYSSSPGNNPTGPPYPSDSHRVMRGGSCGYDAGYIRSARRYFDDPSYSYGSVGFRLARD